MRAIRRADIERNEAASSNSYRLAFAGRAACLAGGDPKARPYRKLMLAGFGSEPRVRAIAGGSGCRVSLAAARCAIHDDPARAVRQLDHVAALDNRRRRRRSVRPSRHPCYTRLCCHWNHPSFGGYARSVLRPPWRAFFVFLMPYFSISIDLRQY